MSKASNRKNNFLKQRRAKIRRTELKSGQKNAVRNNARKNSRNFERFAGENLSEKTIDSSVEKISEMQKKHSKPGFLSRNRGVPDHALAADLVQSDARGNLRRNLTRRNDSRPPIAEMVREATAGGVIYRLNQENQLEILLVADHFDRWTIPKGHIEPGETAQETAIREIGEEAGLFELEPICWLGKIHFRYRRQNTLVLMSTQIYLFQALGDTDKIKAEDWMNGIKWFEFSEAVDIVAYEDIAKLMLLGRNRLRHYGRIK